LIGLQTDLWNSADYLPESSIQGLHLEGAQRGLYMRNMFGDMAPSITDLSISKCTDAGISMRVGDSSGCAGSAASHFERIHLERNGIGVRMDSVGCTDLTFEDCEFTNQVGDGILWSAPDS